MNNLKLTYSPYKLELKSSFESAHGKIYDRKGFIISIKNAEGVEGLGDVAPFPEIGSESMGDAERALKSMKLDLKIELTNIHESFKELLYYYDSLPSLRHGIEQALLNLICREKNVTIDKLLDLNIKRIINSIKALRDEFGNDVILRIDVNGKWKLDEAVKYLSKLEEFNLEYAEQPVNSLDEFIKLKSKTSVPLAVDESIRTKKDAENFIKKNAIDYLILKPMIIGGLLQTLEIIELAEKNNITPVITSSFESAIGKANAVIAAATVKKGIAHGLALTDYFKNDIIPDPFPVKDGKINLSD
jgi:L-alanine-DL-glutamate epimerase-like enolase superfamily enzyme